MNPKPPKRPIVRHYADRVTVDLDSKGGGLEFRAVQVWHNLLNDADAVDVHVSSSGSGLHFVAYYEEPLEFHEKIAIRRANHDDLRRVDMEIQRWRQGLAVDVLFSQKDSHDESGLRTKERRFADVYDALDYIRGRRRDADRVKRLANHGHKGAPDLARRLEASA